MKAAIGASLLAALSCASVVLADAAQADPNLANVERSAEDCQAELRAEERDLEIRQIPGQVPAATQAPHQLSPITTIQMNVDVGGHVTYIPVPYTQLFDVPPDKSWPAPIPGTIGLGTLAQAAPSKRDAAPEAEPTDGLPTSSSPSQPPPYVLGMHTVAVTQWVHPVVQVVVYETMESSASSVPLRGYTSISNLTIANSTWPNATNSSYINSTNLTFAGYGTYARRGLARLIHGVDHGARERLV